MADYVVLTRLAGGLYLPIVSLGRSGGFTDILRGVYAGCHPGHDQQTIVARVEPGRLWQTPPRLAVYETAQALFLDLGCVRFTSVT
jgi:hypothetical protein